MVAGESAPDRLLAHSTGRLKASRERLLSGLHGVVIDHHRFLLALHLEEIEHAEATIRKIEEPIDPAAQKAIDLVLARGVPPHEPSKRRALVRSEVEDVQVGIAREALR